SNGELRARVLYGFAQALRADADRLAELLTREQGKTIHEAHIEIAGSAKMTEYYAGLARLVYGRSAVLGDEVTGVVLREPVGVVAVITPWNWPLTLLVRSLVPALAAGNATVVKPASITPAITVEALALLAAQPGLPDGVLTCVLGAGATVGEVLVGHDGVDMIAFTGETATGIRVMKRAADGLRKVALELGGKAPNVVFADANIDKALAGAENAIFTTCGQICTAGSRLIVEDSIHDELVTASTRPRSWDRSRRRPSGTRCSSTSLAARRRRRSSQEAPPSRATSTTRATSSRRRSSRTSPRARPCSATRSSDRC
ncbi:MAG: aldehyde dehydrogenase, partial [Actinobacteria bacterium]